MSVSSISAPSALPRMTRVSAVTRGWLAAVTAMKPPTVSTTITASDAGSGSSSRATGSARCAAERATIAAVASSGTTTTSEDAKRRWRRRRPAAVTGASAAATIRRPTAAARQRVSMSGRSATNPGVISSRKPQLAPPWIAGSMTANPATWSATAATAPNAR